MPCRIQDETSLQFSKRQGTINCMGMRESGAARQRTAARAAHICRRAGRCARLLISYLTVCCDQDRSQRRSPECGGRHSEGRCSTLGECDAAVQAALTATAATTQHGSRKRSHRALLGLAWGGKAASCDDAQHSSWSMQKHGGGRKRVRRGVNNELTSVECEQFVGLPHLQSTVSQPV